MPRDLAKPSATASASPSAERGETLPFMEALNAAQHAMTIVQSTDDSKEGPLAFREKRAPSFTGR